MTKPLYIHAGAHRTGTSSFQLCLQRNRDALSAAGYDVAYPGRDGVPGGKLRLRLPGPRHGPRKIPKLAQGVADEIKRHSPEGTRGLILSEENIPGRMFHFYQGQFFPAAEARLSALAQGAGAPPKHVIYVLRSYAQIYASAYRKRAEDNAVVPFDEIVPQFLQMDRGWPDLLVGIRDILKPEQLTVLPYTRRGTSVDLLTRLVPGLDGVTLQEPEKTMNLSATDAALIALQARHHAGQELSRAQWQEIVGQHADDKEDHGFARFSDADTATLDARYERDLERVSDMVGLDFI